MRVARNSDLRIRELERRWRASGLEGDRAAWLRARIRAGDPHAQAELDYPFQVLEAARQREWNQAEGFHKLMFPEAETFGDLFTDWAPVSEGVVLRFPVSMEPFFRTLDRTGMAAWSTKALRGYVSEATGVPLRRIKSAGVEPDPVGGFYTIGATIESERPTWAYRQSYEVGGEYGSLPVRLFVEDHDDLWVRAHQSVYDYLADNMAVPDAWDFTATLRRFSSGATTALIQMRANRIIASRWLTILPALSIPTIGGGRFS